MRFLGKSGSPDTTILLRQLLTLLVHFIPGLQDMGKYTNTLDMMYQLLFCLHLFTEMPGSRKWSRKGVLYV